MRPITLTPSAPLHVMTTASRGATTVDTIHSPEGEYTVTRHWHVLTGRRHLILEEWMCDGDHHRVGGPAVRQWTVVNGDRRLTREEWWQRGGLHRAHGPAYQLWSVHGDYRRLLAEDWWVDGEVCREGLSSGRHEAGGKIIIG